MMKPFHFISVLVLFFTACGGTKNTTDTIKITQQEVALPSSDSLLISIEAINLSEDMSRVSTKNDEILILIYEWKDSLELNQFLFRKQLIFNEKNRSKTVSFFTDQDLSNSRLILFLIEQDDDTPSERIDPIIRVYYQSILDAYQNGDYSEIEKYLGDEDILGIQTISKLDTKTPTQFRFSGIHKLDKYEYHIILRNKME